MSQRANRLETAFEMYMRILRHWESPLDADKFRSRIIAKMCDLAPEQARIAISAAHDSVDKDR